MTDDKRYIYICFGDRSLVKAEVIKETPKTFLLGEKETIVGYLYYMPDRIRKEKYRIFDSRVPALEFMISRVRRTLTRSRDTVRDIEDCLETLIEMRRHDQE